MFLSRKRIVMYVTVIVLLSAAQGLRFCDATSLEPPEKIIGLKFLEEVVGIDIKSYNLSGFRMTENLVDFVLTSRGSKIDVMMSFVNQTMTWCNLYVSGTPILKIQYPNDYLDAAKSFLERYKVHFNTEYCDRLIPLLDKINTLDQSSIVSEDAVLSLTGPENSVSFRWNCRVNGIEAPRKNLGLTFTKGFLRAFVDNWGITKIGGTTINISEEEARNVALNVSKYYINNIGAKVTEIEATLSITNDEDSGRGSAYILYPSWHIMLWFDKFYPGSIAGYYVDIWADTCEVYRADSWGWVGSPSGASWFDVILPTVVIVAIALPAILAIITVIHKKQQRQIFG